MVSRITMKIHLLFLNGVQILQATTRYTYISKLLEVDIKNLINEKNRIYIYGKTYILRT